MFWILIYLLVSDEIDNWGLIFKYYASQDSIKPPSLVKFEILELVLTFILFFSSILSLLWKFQSLLHPNYLINHNHRDYVYYVLYP